MAAIQARGDAGGANPRVVIRNRGKPRECRGIRRRLQDALHVRAGLAADDFRFTLKIFARDLVELEWKLIFFQARQALGELIDRIFGSGQRTVAAGIVTFRSKS